MKQIKSAKPRKTGDSELTARVGAIIEDIRKNGDNALLFYQKKFDGIQRKDLRIRPEEIQAAYQRISYSVLADMKTAAKNIEFFARAQRETLGDLEDVSPAPGLYLGHRVLAVDSCLCYVPGGNYPLYSSALMLAIPAKVAGVKRVVACSPLKKGEEIMNPLTLVAMDLAGVDEIYGVGGAHGIAAFAYGTPQLDPVHLIVGPGNRYVTEAKRQCYGQVGIDFVAGPSEVMVIAEETASASMIAADLLAQSEHDVLAKGILVTDSMGLAREVEQEVKNQLKSLKTREIAEKSWNDYGEILLVQHWDEAIDYANEYGPEHLELHGETLIARKKELRHYGSLFLGQETAEVFGDYASGTNHTLPTMGAAKYTGGVSVGTFMKTCTYQRMEKQGTDQLAPLVERLALGEGLHGHSRAARMRISHKK